jgi:tetratricopeptide (TPR) repeat protein
MKAEHRKELQTNTLAKTLGQTLQGLKEGPSRTTVVVLVLIALAAVLIFTWRYFSSASQEADSALWYKWDNLAAPDQLEGFLKNKEAEETIQGRLSRFLAARRALHEGLLALGQKDRRDQAQTNLKQAAELYSKLATEPAKVPSLTEEALLGAAQAFEALGDYDKARDLYGQLADKYKDTLQGQSAQRQLDRLNNPANQSALQDLRSLLAAPPAPRPEGAPGQPPPSGPGP